jgi:cell wall-associated NlpC family hydrolase
MTGPYLFSTLVLLAPAALAGCGPAEAAPSIADLREIPQNCRAALGPGLADTTLIAPDVQTRLAEEYRQEILSPWRPDTPSPGGLAAFSADPANEVLAIFCHWPNDTIGENLQPRPAGWSAALMSEANGQDYPNCRRRAITVRNTSIRQLPTAEPAFLPPGKGVGYPFDRLQESAIWANTPIRVTHVSRSGAWVWAKSCFSAGWVPAGDVAFVDEAIMDAWRTHPLAAIVRDGVSLRSSDGAFVAAEHIGAVLPLADAGGAHAAPGAPPAGLDVLAAARMPDGTAKAVRVPLAPRQAEMFPVSATTGRLADLADRMIGQSYGWGGLYQQRDCSAMIRDLFAPFGLYLPRNSSEQARAGQAIPLDGMSDDAKERRIIRDGAPMLTLLGAPGHIMLYLGQRDSKALILHNTWGVKVRQAGGDEGFKLIGRCCITTLRPGIELPNIILPDGDLRHMINVMVRLDGGDNFDRLRASEESER